MNLKISAWSAIILAILVIPSFISGVLFALYPDNTMALSLLIALVIISIILGILIVIGYAKVAKANNKSFLEIMAYILIIASITFNIYSFFAGTSNVAITLLFFVSMGIIMTLFGIAALTLKKTFGGIIIAIAILYIIGGIFIASIILVIIYPLIAIAINILEAIFFFEASKKYK